MFEFLASRNGRILRIVVGAILLIIGLALVFTDATVIGAIIAVIGVFPVVAGAFDLCLFAPFAGKSLKGPELRQEEMGAAEIEE